jgi:hypothetical protein
VKTNNLIHRCVHLSFEKSYRIIMNRSPQFDVYFHAKNASGTPNYPGTYSTLTSRTNMALSHLTEHKSGEHPHLNPHTVHYFATHEEYNRENTNDKL